MAAYVNHWAVSATQQSVQKALASAGIIGPVLFALLVVVQGLMLPEYSHLSEPVSALAAGPDGWVQNVTFLLTGALMTAHALGLHWSVGRGIPWLGPALLVVSGLGLVGAGLFPAIDASGAFSREPSHVVSAVTAFAGAGLGLAVVSRHLSRTAGWRGYGAYALLSGAAVLVLTLGMFALAAPPEAPLHGWLGLVQRLTVAVWFACVAVLAVKVLRSTPA